jgi:hypothetical protein
MIRHPTARAILTELNLQEVFFPNQTAEEKEDHCRRIIRFVAFKAGRKDSQMWFNHMEATKKVPEILGDMIEMISFDRPYDPFHLGPYDHIFTDLAIVEGATALDLTSNKKKSYAVLMYLKGVKSTIEIYKRQQEIKAEDEAKLVPAKRPFPSSVETVEQDEPQPAMVV